MTRWDGRETQGEMLERWGNQTCTFIASLDGCNGPVRFRTTPGEYLHPGTPELFSCGRHLERVVDVLERKGYYSEVTGFGDAPEVSIPSNTVAHKSLVDRLILIGIPEKEASEMATECLKSNT